MNVPPAPLNLAGGAGPWGPGAAPQMGMAQRPILIRTAGGPRTRRPYGCKHSKQRGGCHWRKKYFALLCKKTAIRFDFRASAISLLRTIRRRLNYLLSTTVYRCTQGRSPLLAMPKEVKRMLFQKLLGSAIFAVEIKDGKPLKRWIDGDLSLMFANRQLLAEGKVLLRRVATLRICYREATSTPHLLVNLLEHIDPAFLSQVEKLDIQSTSATGWPPPSTIMNDFSVLHGFSLCPVIPGRTIAMMQIREVRILVTQLQILDSPQEIHLLANKSFACGLDIKNSYLKREHASFCAILRRDLSILPRVGLAAPAGFGQIRLQRRWGFQFTDYLDLERTPFDIDSERGRKVQLHLLHAECDIDTGDVRSETWLNNWQIRKRYHYGKAVAQDDWLLVDW